MFRKIKFNYTRTIKVTINFHENVLQENTQNVLIGCHMSNHGNIYSFRSGGFHYQENAENRIKK